MMSRMIWCDGPECGENVELNMTENASAALRHLDWIILSGETGKHVHLCPECKKLPAFQVAP